MSVQAPLVRLVRGTAGTAPGARRVRSLHRVRAFVDLHAVARGEVEQIADVERLRLLLPHDDGGVHVGTELDGQVVEGGMRRMPYADTRPSSVETRNGTTSPCAGGSLPETRQPSTRYREAAWPPQLDLERADVAGRPLHAARDDVEAVRLELAAVACGHDGVGDDRMVHAGLFGDAHDDEPCAVDEVADDRAV